MPYEKSVSFRTHLQSYTVDLLKDANVRCPYTADLVVSLASLLAAYREEGTALSPSVYICNSIDKLVRMSGAGEFVSLSAEIDTSTAAERILKAAAPLCSGIWNIFVERTENGKHCRFGIFCGTNDPSSISVDGVLLRDSDDSFPVICVTQSVTNKVEVRTNAGSGIEFRFNDDADVPHLDNRSKITALASAVCDSVTTSRKDDFTSFIERLLVSAIRDSHGTLIAVVSGDGAAMPAELTDGIVFHPAVDLFERYVLHFDEEKTAVSVGRLQVAADLLAGFVNSDGITVFDSCGKILGYRIFIQSGEPDAPSNGGARTRAFVALTKLVGTGLSAAFFRSQDGLMKLHVPDARINGDV